MILRSFMVLCSGGIWSGPRMHAVCTCSHAFKHAMTLGEGADAAAAAATAYITRRRTEVSESCGSIDHATSPSLVVQPVQSSVDDHPSRM
jgi:hypothetical protein